MITINSVPSNHTLPQIIIQSFAKLTVICNKVNDQLHNILNAAEQGECGGVFKFRGEKISSEFDGIVEETKLCWRELFRLLKDDGNTCLQQDIEGFIERALKMLELAETIPVATVGLSYLKEYIVRCDAIIATSLNLQNMFINQWKQRTVSYETAYDLWLQVNESFPKDLVSLAKWKTSKNVKRMKRFIKELGETDEESIDEDEIDRILPSRIIDRGALVASVTDMCEMNEFSLFRRRKSTSFKEHTMTKHSATLLKLCHKLLRKIKQKCIPNSAVGSIAISWLDTLLLTSDKLIETSDTLMVHLCKNPNPTTSTGIAISVGRIAIKLAEHARLRAGDNPYHPHQRWFDEWQRDTEEMIEHLLDFAPSR